MFCSIKSLFRLAGANYLSLVNMKYGLTFYCSINLCLLQRFLALFPLHIELRHQGISEEPKEK